MTELPSMPRRGYAGVFMVTLANLMFETVLTRIFSVSMQYHFAFVAVSVALFGMTVGAVLVYLLPSFFRPARALRHASLSALLFALSMVACFLTHLAIPFVPSKSFVGLYGIALTYAVIAIPFVFGGICVCLAMTKFPRQVGGLYAADLWGAGMGCIVFIAVLKITDGPTAVLVAATLASAGAMLLSRGSDAVKVRRLTAISTLVLALFAAGNGIMAVRQTPLVRLMWVLGTQESRPLYEKWNSFSRVRVHGDPDRLTPPFGWGLSPAYPVGKGVQQLGLTIDAVAETVLTKRVEDPAALDYLKYDVTNLAYYLRSQANVLVIGAGGGRDVLSALTFDARSVQAVEINEEIVSAVNGRFGDYTGHLDRDPRVKFVVDEARSYTARQKDRYDIIQISLIDTFAGTAAGAYVLSESTLYTIEGWRVFLDHLTPNGVFSVSRWYYCDAPAEAYRTVSLAAAVLRERGVANPRDHMLLIRGVRSESEPNAVGTLLVSPGPFTARDVQVIEDVARSMRFSVVLSPGFAVDQTFADLATGLDVSSVVDRLSLNVAPPTDNSPFFFQMLRPKDLFNRTLLQQGYMSFNMVAVTVLGVLLLTVTLLTLLFIVVPLALTTNRSALKGTGSLFIFFAAIGLGFMLVEISQMQRLAIFLGHPTYGLSVVLFSLLVSSGLGSHTTQRISQDSLRRQGFWRLGALVIVVAAFGLLTPVLTSSLQAATTPVRIAVAAASLLPAGFFMGMCFPLGMRLASRALPEETRRSSVSAWLWGINGAASVCASVFAVVLALVFGISTAFWTGCACYFLALGSFFWTARKASVITAVAP